MTAEIRLAAIVRHPVKSIGHEEIARVPLTAGRALPFDRVWAVAHEAAQIAPDAPQWAKKMNFLRGVAGPELMAIAAASQPQARRITLRHPRAEAITLSPDLAEDQARLLAWLRPLWPDSRPAPAFVTTAGDGAMTDVPQQYVSVLNLASLRDLSGRMGMDLSIHRFRGNLWIDGLAPFAELDLIGRRLRIGDAVLAVCERITRCRATCTDPATGRESGETLAALKAGYGHQDFGIYAMVESGGEIAAGDPVELI